jgi:hypothetical protein
MQRMTMRRRMRRQYQRIEFVSFYLVEEMDYS